MFVLNTSYKYYMDNINGFNSIPPTLLMFLTENMAARDRFMGMDDNERRDFLKSSENFQSKEEMERYLYHKEHDQFR